MISVGAGIVIANPDSGPGAALDDNYVKYIQKARDAGIAVTKKSYYFQDLAGMTINYTMV